MTGLHKSAYGVFATLFLTLALTFVLWNLSPTESLGGVATYGSAAAATSVVIVFSISKINGLQSMARQEDNLVSSLSSAIFYNSCGMPLQRAIELSVRGDPGRVSKTLICLSRKLRLGQSFSDAFVSTGILKNSKTFVNKGQNTVTTAGIHSSISLRELLLAGKLSKIEESVQRYSTASMFAAVILPSFILFSLIGSSVMSAGSGSMDTIYLMLVCAVPALYSVCSLLISRRLNG